MNEDKWMSIYKYAALRGVSKQKIYMDIRLGKIPAEMVRKAEVLVTRIQIREDYEE